MIGSSSRILVVDDDMLNRQLLSTNLREAGYTVEMAEDGQKAIELVRAQLFDVVLLDLIMPGIDGFQVLQHLKADRALRHIPIIVISATDEMKDVVRCIEMGATDYLTKPFNPVLLHARIKASLATKQLHDQEELHRHEIEEYNRQLESRVQEQVHEIREGYERLQKVLDGTVLALSLAVERRDPYTAGHQQRVTQLACAIAGEMGLPEKQIAGTRVAGILHDIGKICVPAEILSKPGQITEAEFGIIKVHPEAGYDILKSIEFAWPIAEIVRQHQERLNGSGYPSGLSGEGILLEARIITVSDVVEAMSSHRPYRPALPMEKALAEISKNRGILYHPNVVDACLKLVQEKRFQFEQTSSGFG